MGIKSEQKNRMTETNKVSFREKVGYGFGDAAASMFWKLFSMYLLFFYTDIFGLPAAVVGTMFLVTRIWDAANDAIMGIIADRTISRWGKFRPYILFLAVPFAFFGVLTFSTPNLDLQGKIIYAYITYSLMMMVYTGINVPYASLLGVMTSDPGERTSLATYRMLFGFGGSVLVLGAVEPLVGLFESTFQGEQSTQRAWQAAAGVFALLSILFFMFNFSWSRERIRPKREKSLLRNDLRDLVGNKPWFILLGAGISTLIFNSIRDGSVIYYFKYFIADQEAIKSGWLRVTFTYSTLYLVVGQTANIIGVLLARPVSDRLGKKRTFFYAMLLAAGLSLLFYLLSMEQIFLIFTLQFFISICAGIIFPLLWSMFADIADYSEWKTGRRATGLIFSSSSMSQKMGWTLGGALTGWLLAIFGFEANAVQSAESLNGIRMMMSIFPAIGAVLSALLIYRYKLSDAFMSRIIKELNHKRTINND
jgi:glycoside/pentoside/hexuronide:cation symporter, GPH family